MTRTVIGLTGGIGTGKSHVLDTLASLGARQIDADLVAREVMAPGGPAHDRVVREFGAELVAADGAIDRVRLGQIVFADPARLARLEAIVHPAVFEAIRSRLGDATEPVVVIEAIKLLEAGLSRTLCDRVWVTSCSRRQQVARLARGRGMKPDEARRRIASQMPVAEMAVQADRVIDTNGTMAETELALLAAWAEDGLPFPRPVVRAGEIGDAEGIAAVLNSVVREGGRTTIDRVYSPEQERRFLRGLPARSLLTVARLGCVVVGFQVVEPCATYTATMAHVSTIGSYVAAPARGRGVGRALMEATARAARDAGFEKQIAAVRADNMAALAFYEGQGFRRVGVQTSQIRLDGRYIDQVLLERFL